MFAGIADNISYFLGCFVSVRLVCILQILSNRCYNKVHKKFTSDFIYFLWFKYRHKWLMKQRTREGNEPNPKTVFPLTEHQVKWGAYKHAMWLPTRCMLIKKISFKTMQIMRWMMVRMGHVPINFIFMYFKHWFTHFISLVRIHYLQTIYQTLIITCSFTYFHICH